MRYIALLRGINVSGQKKIKMDKLRAMCEKMAYQNVRTYLQSGNIVFDTDQPNKKKVEQDLCEQIQSTLGYEVKVIVNTEAYFKKVVANNPFLAERPDLDIKLLHVTFLSAVPEGSLVISMQETDYGTDEFKVIEDRVYLCFPNGYGKTKLSNNVFERKLKLSATTRNWKTVLALLEIASQR